MISEKTALSGTYLFCALLVATGLWAEPGSFAAQTNVASATAASVGGHGVETNSVARGRQLFLLNCAHCHAEDASGDEGPDLHGLLKSDTKMTSLIRNGIKGKMPKFGAKLTDAEIRALLIHIRALE